MGGLLVTLVLLAAGPAAAHASLTGSTPAAGSTLDTAPATVELDFNENVGNADVVVTAPDGTEVGVSEVEAVDRQVTATVADVDQAGTYTLSFRVVSADGHPIQDSLRYDVTAGQAVQQQDPPADTQQGFVHRHRSHIFWGVLAAAVAVGLLLMPLRDREDTAS